MISRSTNVRTLSRIARLLVAQAEVHRPLLMVARSAGRVRAASASSPGTAGTPRAREPPCPANRDGRRTRGHGGSRPAPKGTTSSTPCRRQPVQHGGVEQRRRGRSPTAAAGCRSGAASRRRTPRSRRPVVVLVHQRGGVGIRRARASSGPARRRRGTAGPVPKTCASAVLEPPAPGPSARARPHGRLA